MAQQLKSKRELIIKEHKGGTDFSSDNEMLLEIIELANEELDEYYSQNSSQNLKETNYAHHTYIF